MLLRSPPATVALIILLIGGTPACGSPNPDDASTLPDDSSGLTDAASDSKFDSLLEDASAELSEDSYRDEPAESSLHDATGSDQDSEVSTSASNDAPSEADSEPPSDGNVSSEASPMACNGNAAYCDRPYNQVSVACTHNAQSNEEDPGFDIPTPNQKYSFLRQLHDDVRCMMIDTYSYLGIPSLCHAYCELGATPWVPMLKSVKTWLDAHPHEVLTFILESYLSEKDTLKALQDGGVFPMVYHHAALPGSPWPTLRWMIEHDQRLVVFTDDPNASGDWLMHWPSFGWETPYNDPTFTCANGRGDPTAFDNQVFILNHYTLCTAGGCASNGQTNNVYSSIFPRAAKCWQKEPQYNPWGQIPTFVTVDHYEVPSPGEGSPSPDVFDAVRALNANWPGPPQ